MGAITLALVGCFAEPPSGGGSGSSTTGEGTSSSGTSSDPATSGGSESGPGSSGTDDPDTGSSSSSSTGDMFACEKDVVETGRVPADVLVIVGEASALPTDFLDFFNMMTHVAVLAPEAVTSELEAQVPEACQAGCAVACTPPGRVLLPYAADKMGAAFDAFLIQNLDCVFRPPPRGTELSEPSRQLWLFTQNPNVVVPNLVRARMLTLDLRLHVACPGCSSMPPNDESYLGALVAETGGSFADINGMLSGQLGTLTAPRTSCSWAEEDVPSTYRIENGRARPGDPFLAVDSTAVAVGRCEETVGEGEDAEVTPQFVDNGDGTVELCPVACRFAQLEDLDSTDIYRCN